GPFARRRLARFRATRTTPARIVAGSLAAAAFAGHVVQPHGQGDALTREVHVHHLHLDDVAGLDHVTRVLDELVRHRRHVYQPVLVHTDIDEGAEGGDVADASFQHHADFE